MAKTTGTLVLPPETIAVSLESDDKNHKNHYSSSSRLPVAAPPHEDPSLDSVDALINEEMCKLSLGERDQVQYDVHGVSEDIEETPDFVAACQAHLRDELDKIDHDEKEAYNLAQEMDASYVQDPKFRLKFLRADLFDAKQAAIRLVKNLQYKLELFGKELLVKDIAQDDLDKEALDCLYCGFWQVLPVKDRAGRAITIWMPKLRPRQDIKSKLRRLYYSMMISSEDEDIQKKGMVSIQYIVGMTLSDYDRESAWSIPSLSKIVPFRVVGIHVCYNHPIVLPFLAFAKLALNSFSRLRVRPHYGSHQDIVYKLQTFGIPTYALPFDEDGNPTISQNRRDWEKRLAYERTTIVNNDNQRIQADTKRRILVPGPQDVMLGRGRLCQEHSGNVKYRYLIEEYKEQYDAGSKRSKTQTSMLVISIVKEQSGRFLKEDKTGWKEVEPNVARAKIAHSFRSLRTAAKSGEITKTAPKRTSIPSNGRSLDSPVPLLNHNKMERGMADVRVSSKRSLELF